MGWSFTKGATKEDIVAERVGKSWSSPEHGYSTCLAHRVIGNRLWSVWEHAKDGVVRRYIALDLLQPDKGFGWGYKDIDESMGPFYYDCPLPFLDMVTEPRNETAKEWRDEVRAYHAKKAQQRKIVKSIKVGDLVTMEGRNPAGPYQVTSLKPFLGVLVATGRVFKLVKSAAVPYMTTDEIAAELEGVG